MAQSPEEVIANLTEGWDIECKLAHGQRVGSLFAFLGLVLF